MSDSDTLSRQLIQTYFLRCWRGELLDQKTFCPVGVQPIDFDPEVDRDVAPWTPAEVRGTDAVPGTGYIYLRMVELERRGDGTTSGMQDLGEGLVQTVGEFVILGLDFEINVPRERSPSVDERYAGEIRRRFQALSIPFEGPPRFTLRQLQMYPMTLVKVGEDGIWRRSMLRVRMRRQERRAVAGTQAVTLPPP